MIALGSLVKDNITGYQGIATARMTHLHGCVHICILPKELLEGRPQKEYLFDEQRVDVIEASDREATKPILNLGSHVRDTISGYEGVITIWTEELYGKPYITVASTHLHDGKVIESIQIPESRAELIEERKPKVSLFSSAATGSIHGSMTREPLSK